VRTRRTARAFSPELTLALACALAGLAPAAAAAEDRYLRGEIVPRIVCRSDSRYSFALYLPRSFEAEKGRSWPLLLVFDARGGGALAAERFREGAERFGWVVASSNDTKSDDASAPNGEAIQAMWKDALSRFPIDSKRIVTTGFSGGARLAFAVAMSRASESGGVIAASGGLPTGEPARSNPGFPVFGTAGARDFNYREMRALDRSLEKSGASHRLEVFDGGHEWLPAALGTRAIAWLEVQAMKRGTRPADEKLASALLAESLARARAAEASGDVAAAYEEAADAVKSFDGLTGSAVREAREMEARLKPAALVLLQEAARRDAREEQSVRHLREEMDRILAADEPVPFATIASRLEIARWRERASSSGAPGPGSSERLSAQRVVESLYTRAVFYQPTEFFAKKDPRRAALSLEIAAAFKPDSFVAWYDLACARARAGDSRRALEALKTAIDKGFPDAKHVATDPDLESLHGLPEFQDLVKRIPARAAN
jgi:predicted esterase